MNESESLLHSIDSHKESEYDAVIILISSDLVSWFANLTGDFSSIHTKNAFSKDSVYRRRIVHGMLPLVFLLALPDFQTKDGLAILRKITANFMKPVFIGDQLIVKARPLKQFDKTSLIREIEYVIQNKKTKATLASGYCTLEIINYDVSNNRIEKGHGCKSFAHMVLDHLTEQNLVFESINKGDNASFCFTINNDHIASLYSMINRALIKTGANNMLESFERSDVTNLLAALLLSTFVGMCMPGRYATFTNLSLSFQQNILRNVVYKLLGKVSFCSQSTMTITEDVILQEKKDEIIPPAASGKIQCKINAPPIGMPSIQELQRSVDIELKGKVILITGASGGIGETIAKMFSLYGANVVVNYNRSKDSANKIAKEIVRHGGEAIAIQADVSKRDQVDKMLAIIFQKYQKIDVLVNNAVHANYPSSFMELTWESIQKEIDVTIKGAFNCIQGVLPNMVERRSGKIINISTIYTDNPPPKQASYVTAKSGLVGLTRSLAIEYAHYGITVNMVVPGIVETNFSRHVSKIFLQGIKNNTPMKRNASPTDVAKAVIILASSLAPFTTGQKIMVNGGSPPFL